MVQTTTIKNQTLLALELASSIVPNGANRSPDASWVSQKRNLS